MIVAPPEDQSFSLSKVIYVGKNLLSETKSREGHNSIFPLGGMSVKLKMNGFPF